MYSISLKLYDPSLKKELSQILNDMVAYVYENELSFEHITDRRERMLMNNTMYKLVNSVSEYNIHQWVKCRPLTYIIYMNSEGEKKIAGVVSGVCKEEDILEIDTLYVRQGFRDIGVGYTAVKYLIRECEISNLRKICLAHNFVWGHKEFPQSVVNLLLKAGFRLHETDEIKEVIFDVT